jgi:hypothetical protein
MSIEGDTFWVSLAERVFGLVLVIIGGLLLYFTATSELLGFSVFFGVISIILVIIGIFLIVVKPAK